MRRRVPWGVLAVLFVVMPLVEIYVVVQSSQLIGLLPTIVLLVVDSLLGAYLLKREGAAAWKALREALGSARLPARELADGALILVGGTLLLTPGFVTDAAGFFLILPFTRPLGRRLLTGLISRKLLGADGSSSRRTRRGRTQRRPGPDSVVQGEVVD